MSDHIRDAAPPAEVWTGRATNRLQWLLALLGAGFLALGVDLAAETAWHRGLAPLLMAVIGCVTAGLLVLFGTLAFVQVRVRVDGEVVDVRCGYAGLPRRRIRLDDVVEAHVVPRVTPRQWGGWGYRWRPEQGMAVVVRRGEGVRVRLGDGRTFTVTVDGAHAAVHAIRARLAPRPLADRPVDTPDRAAGDEGSQDVPGDPRDPR